MSRVEELNGQIIKRQNITDSLILLWIRPDEGTNKFKSGQYTTIGLPGSSPRPDNFPPEPNKIESPEKIIKRAYSIGSSPENEDSYELCIAILPEGQLTSRIALLKEGDRLFVGKKIVGHFTLDPIPPNNNLIFVSTGTGIAPFMSMIRTPSTWSNNRKITMLHGVRHKIDLVYRDELLSLAENNSNFIYHGVVSREDWEGRRGYVQHLIEDGTIQLNPDTDHVLLCGNPAMIDDIEKLLSLKGYRIHSKKEPGNLHHEKYW